MKTMIIIVFMFLFTCNTLTFSQVKTSEDPIVNQTQEATDSVSLENLPVLSSQIYDFDIELNRNYEYDVINKRRSLLKLSNDLNIIGFVSMFATAGILIGIGCTHDWNSWLTVGGGIVGGIGIEWIFYKIADNIRKKADAIIINSVPVADISRRTHILAATFSKNGQKISGIGFGIQYDF